MEETQEEKKLRVLNAVRNKAMTEAEQAAYAYARECDLGHEREKAFEIYENLRTVGRVY